MYSTTYIQDTVKHYLEINKCNKPRTNLALRLLAKFLSLTSTKINGNIHSTNSLMKNYLNSIDSLSFYKIVSMKTYNSTTKSNIWRTDWTEIFCKQKFSLSGIYKSCLIRWREKPFSRRPSSKLSWNEIFYFSGYVQIYNLYIPEDATQ